MTCFDLTILTDPRYLALDPDAVYHQQIAREEGLLIDALDARGLRATRRAWDDPDFDWHSTRAAVFRSTWDYFERIGPFRQWLARVRTQTRLLNPAALIDWNLDKHYLGDLAAAGIAVVPTHFLEPGCGISLARVLADTGWDAVVVKPAISGGARLTWRACRADAATHEAALAECLGHEAMLVQPFEPAIEREGEVSVMVIDGRITHAVGKTARPGDFRVQDDHGGTVHPHAPADDEIDLARRAVAACPEAPLYARVDMVRAADGLRLMELELIEPELFLRFAPEAATDLAAALARAL